MSDDHNALITQFYQAFQRLDADAMCACYTDDVVFSDPAFGTLRGKDAADMWVHEGFTNYSENLFVEYFWGKEQGSEYVIGTRRGIRTIPRVRTRRETRGTTRTTRLARSTRQNRRAPSRPPLH